VGSDVHVEKLPKLSKLDLFLGPGFGIDHPLIERCVEQGYAYINISSDREANMDWLKETYPNVNITLRNRYVTCQEAKVCLCP
jgi:hypothetical protein